MQSEFYSLIDEQGNHDFLNFVEFQCPSFITEGNILTEWEEIRRDNKRTLLYGDYDADGASCLLELIDTFDHVGYNNYEIFKYDSRTHDIDPAAINQALRGGFDYMIICDTGSSSMDVLRRLNIMGVRTIVFDHHETIYSYEDFPGLIVNTTIENRSREDELILSAGALVYLFCLKLIDRLGYSKLQSLAPLALFSLYADSIAMSSPLNRSIYYDAVSTAPVKLPRIIQYFMENKDEFNRRFIQFTVAPKINALFRSEQFTLLNKFLFWTPDDGPITKIVEEIKTIHSETRNMVLTATDAISLDSSFAVMDNFVLGNLSSVSSMVNIPMDGLQHYTGLVANKLAEKYRKTAIVVANAVIEWKGSVRDPFGRDYLEFFRLFSRAGGHHAAFGFHLAHKEYESFMGYIRQIDQQFYIQGIGNAPLQINYNVPKPDIDLLTDIARYNEFSCENAPIALINKIWTPYPGKPSTFYETHYYKWGAASIKSKFLLHTNSTVQIKPYFGRGLSLEVFDVIWGGN